MNEQTKLFLSILAALPVLIFGLSTIANGAESVGIYGDTGSVYYGNVTVDPMPTSGYK